MDDETVMTDPAFHSTELDELLLTMQRLQNRIWHSEAADTDPHRDPDIAADTGMAALLANPDDMRVETQPCSSASSGIMNNMQTETRQSVLAAMDRLHIRINQLDNDKKASRQRIHDWANDSVRITMKKEYEEPDQLKSPSLIEEALEIAKQYLPDQKAQGAERNTTQDWIPPNYQQFLHISKDDDKQYNHHQYYKNQTQHHSSQSNGNHQHQVNNPFDNEKNNQQHDSNLYVYQERTNHVYQSSEVDEHDLNGQLYAPLAHQQTNDSDSSENLQEYQLNLNDSNDEHLEGEYFIDSPYSQITNRYYETPKISPKLIELPVYQPYIPYSKRAIPTSSHHSQSTVNVNESQQIHSGIQEKEGISIYPSHIQSKKHTIHIHTSEPQLYSNSHSSMPLSQASFQHMCSNSQSSLSQAGQISASSSKEENLHRSNSQIGSYQQLPSYSDPLGCSINNDKAPPVNTKGYRTSFSMDAGADLLQQEDVYIQQRAYISPSANIRSTEKFGLGVGDGAPPPELRSYSSLASMRSGAGSGEVTVLQLHLPPLNSNSTTSIRSSSRSPSRNHPKHSARSEQSDSSSTDVATPSRAITQLTAAMNQSESSGMLRRATQMEEDILTSDQSLVESETLTEGGSSSSSLTNIPNSSFEMEQTIKSKSGSSLKKHVDLRRNAKETEKRLYLAERKCEMLENHLQSMRNLVASSQDVKPQKEIVSTEQSTNKETSQINEKTKQTAKMEKLGCKRSPKKAIPLVDWSESEILFNMRAEKQVQRLEAALAREKMVTQELHERQASLMTPKNNHSKSYAQNTFSRLQKLAPNGQKAVQTSRILTQMKPSKSSITVDNAQLEQQITKLKKQYLKTTTKKDNKVAVNSKNTNPKQQRSPSSKEKSTSQQSSRSVATRQGQLLLENKNLLTVSEKENPLLKTITSVMNEKTKIPKPVKTTSIKKRNNSKTTSKAARSSVEVDVLVSDLLQYLLAEFAEMSAEHRLLSRQIERTDNGWQQDDLKAQLDLVDKMQAKSEQINMLRRQKQYLEERCNESTNQCKDNKQYVTTQHSTQQIGETRQPFGVPVHGGIVPQRKSYRSTNSAPKRHKSSNKLDKPFTDGSAPQNVKNDSKSSLVWTNGTMDNIYKVMSSLRKDDILWEH